MRPHVVQLVEKGHLPSSKASVEQIRAWQAALEKIKPPVSDEEAIALVSLFPDTEDDCFGLVWSLIHLVETAPHWPLKDCLENGNNPWIETLLTRLRNAGIEMDG